MVTKPINISGDLKLEGTIVIRLDKLRLVNKTFDGPVIYATSITGSAVVVLEFDKTPELDKAEKWVLLRSTKPIEGGFSSVKVNLTEETLLESLWDSCYSYGVSMVGGTSKELVVNTVAWNECKRMLENHPVRAALISIGVIGSLITALALLVMWRKRRFDQKRRSVLASRLDLESGNESEEMHDVARKEQGYAAAAKLIEQRGTTRFEIGDDDEPEL